MTFLALGAVIALAGCGSAQATSAAAPVSVPASPLPPSQAACVLAVNAFNQIAAPLVDHDAAATAAAAQAEQRVLIPLEFETSLNGILQQDIAAEASAIIQAGDAAQEVEYGPAYYPWSFMKSYELQLDASFRSVESACSAAGIHVSG